MKNLNFENRFFAAVLFSLLIAFILIMFSCCKSEPAERILNNDTIAIYKLENDSLDDYICIFYDTTTKTYYGCTNEMDNRYERPNGFCYSEQIRYENCYFTKVRMKQYFDYKQEYGCAMPDSMLIDAAILENKFVVFYEMTGLMGKKWTVEFCDGLIKSGNLEAYGCKRK